MKKALKVFLALAAAVLIGLTVRTFVMSTVRVEGTSMENTLRSGDIVLVTRIGNTPVRGAIAECRFANRSGHYLKRVIGLPGETLVCKDGIVYIDGLPLDEPYVSSETKDFSVTLEEGQYFVLGDNRVQSYDSREADMGPVRAEDILGIVRLKLLPRPEILK